MTFAASTASIAVASSSSPPALSYRSPWTYPVIVDHVAPSAATAGRSLAVQSHISTWKPRSLMRLTRSRYGTSCQNISVVTASGNIGVATCHSFLDAERFEIRAGGSDLQSFTRWTVPRPS